MLMVFLYTISIVGRKQIRQVSRLNSLLYSAVIIGVAFFMAAAAPAAIAISSISQAYSADKPVSIGSIVSLVTDSTDRIVPAEVKNNDNTLGVVVNNGSSPITIENGGANQVIVATSGVVPVIVSDTNGEIKQGDPVTASEFLGVGMLATTNSKVVGIAQGGMTGKTKQKIKDATGNEREVTLGQLPVLVSVSYHYQTPDKTIIPAALQNVANSIAGKEVKTLPIIISFVIFVIMLISVVAIIYSMIKSSIISVGRNPMAQSAVWRDMIQLSVLVLAILGVSIAAIYFVLTRL